MPIAVIPHPFGSRSRTEVRELAVQCIDDVVRLVCGEAKADAVRDSASVEVDNMIDAPADEEELNKLFCEKHWSDGLPIIAPTPERVARMVAGSKRPATEIVATIAPTFGDATVERIAINAVMAGCEPDYMPVLIAAVKAVASPAFNLQAVQATTNPVTPFIIVNGPVVQRLNINGGVNCLGPGTRANATIGRALRFVLQNIGGAVSGDMDRATQGQPGKYTFCCAENEEASPWEALHVERGFDEFASTVTAAAVGGTLNINTHARDSADLLKMIAEAMTYSCANDYRMGGEPWIVLAPEHADTLHRAGYSKGDVKKLLWEMTKVPAGQMAVKDLERTRHNRFAELGTLLPETLVPISPEPRLISIVVAGGPGTHSIYLPGYGLIRSVTCAIE